MKRLVAVIVMMMTSTTFGQNLAPAPLTMQRPDGRLLAGDIIRLSFYAGSASEPVAGLFGLSFELKYTAKQFIRPLTPEQAISGPFLEPNTYNFAKHEPGRNLVSLAVSRKLGASGQYGEGEVLIYSFVVSEDAPVGAEICFSLGNISANDSVGAAIPMVAGPDLCLKVAELTIDVVPNPFTPNDDGSNDQVEFKREGGIPPEWSIVIMDRDARVVRRLSNGEAKWNGRDQQQRAMLPGVYLYMIQNGEEIVKRGVIGLVR
jgi:gliding motility-associated-like protein